MAQNEPQGMEAAGASGTTGSKTSAGSQGTGATQGAVTGSAATTTQGSGTTSGEQQTQSGGRLSRREGWEDPLSTFFGGSPFALFRRLSDDMDRLFFGGGQGLGSFGGLGLRFMPTVDVEERDDKIVVRADLPGVNPDDFRVDIEDDALVLQGERRTVREDTRGGIRRSERSYGSFRRVIPLPPGVNPEAVEARFENGVLEIEMPLQQQSRTRRVEVRSGSSTSDPTRH
jgi:HSP20 family protein